MATSLSLPADATFAKIAWIAASKTHPSHEFQYLMAYPFGHITGGTVPLSVASSYLSTNLPGFNFGCSVLPNLTGAGAGDVYLRAVAATWTPTVDVVVRASFVRRCVDTTSQASVDGGFLNCAIFQRISGSYATCLNAGTPKAEYAEYFDCYALWVNSSSTEPDANLTIRLIGITHSSGAGASGTARELAKHTIVGGISNLDLAAGVEVDFSITDVGGDPVILARLHGYSAAQSRATVVIFDTSVLGGTVALGSSVANVNGQITDSHADKITGTGGFGLGLPASRDDTVGGSSVEITEGISWVRVSSVSSGSVLYGDNFDRVGIGGITETLGFNVFHRATSVHGHEGAWLNSLWAYGGAAATDNTNADVDPLLGRTIVGTTSYDGVDYARPHISATVPFPGDSPHEREFYSTRPSDYDYTHHRKLEFQILDHQVVEALWTGAVDRYGVLVRGSPQAGYIGQAFVAYLEAIFIDSGGLTQSALKCVLAARVDTGIDGTAIYLTMWEKTIAGIDLADGGWHDIDYDVHVFEDATDIGAPLIHLVKIDGVAVVFDTPGAWAADTQVLSDGRVFDASQLGPQNPGSTEGFFIYSSINETDNSSNVLFNPAKIRNWTQETLTVKTDALAPGDMATYAWDSDEGAADATGDLTLIFNAVFPERVLRVATDPIDIELETGHRITRGRGSRTRRRWTLLGSPQSVAERDTLEAFWSSHGVTTAFDWTPDNETTVIVHFVERPRFRKVGVATWIPSLVIQEVLA